MSDNWQNDLSASASDFYFIVWPRISHWFGGGELLPVESIKGSDMAEHLDRLAGIDAWHLQEKQHRMRGIASRVQWSPNDTNWTTENVYKTFTIRFRRTTGSATELEKRLDQINGGWLYPSITVQAYLDKRGGSLLYACGIRTIDLYRAIEMYPELLIKRVNSEDGNEFYCIAVTDLRDKRIEVKDDLKKPG